jgi:hypothetical protein
MERRTVWSAIYSSRGLCSTSFETFDVRSELDGIWEFGVTIQDLFILEAYVGIQTIELISFSPDSLLIFH